MKKKWEKNWIAPLLLLLLVAICLLTVVLRSNQSSLSKPFPQTITGEYSRDGETWYPLDDNADLDALNGDLFLRGHFSYDIFDGGRLYYYQNHIGVTIYLNGELLLIDNISEYEEEGLVLEPSMCGSRWDYIMPPGITTEDVVELRLHNPHSHGNSSAYRDFLNTLYNSPDTSYILVSYLKPYSLPLQIAGIVLIIVALMLLGAALTSRLMRVPMGGSLWKYGLLTLFMGGFVILDTVGFSFVSELVVFNTYARQLCIMLAVYCMGLIVCDTLTGKPRKTANAAMLLSALLDGILIVLSFIGVTVIYDTGFYWMASQVVLCPLLIGCTAVEWHHREKKSRIILLFYMFLLSAVLLDIAGVGQSIYSHGTCTKSVFALLFVLYAAGAVKNIAIDRRASIQAGQMERELEDSRIAITLSQLQPHFIYNVLNSIYHLCARDPKLAQEAVDKFSDYLRNNMKSIEQKEPIPFEEEFEHIQTYLSLEKIRFRTLEIIYDVDVVNFMLPPLTVQPLVENAVKHGVTKKWGGGSVTISTRETGEAYLVMVIDTGVGFDPERYSEDSKVHIGIKNVRERLQNMVNGTLSITSSPENGTTAVITIPKKEAGSNEDHRIG